MSPTDASVRTAVDAALTALGGLDVLVNCAGIGAVGGVTDNDHAEWHRVLDVNVLGLVRVTRAALPALRASALRTTGRSSIVNVCSIAATAGLPMRVPYAASKGAVASLSQAMAADLLPDGIRVNAVNPPPAPRRPSTAGCWGCGYADRSHSGDRPTSYLSIHE